MAGSLVAGSWGAFGWRPGCCAEPKLAQVVAGASIEDGAWSAGEFAFLATSSLAIITWTRSAHLGRIDRSFGAQLLCSGIALRDDLNRLPDWLDLRLNRQSPSSCAASGIKARISLQLGGNYDTGFETGRLAERRYSRATTADDPTRAKPGQRSR